MKLVLANLHVKMYDVLGMNELDSFTNLSHDADASFLRQQKVFGDGSVEQLTAIYTATSVTTSSSIKLISDRTVHTIEYRRGEKEKTQVRQLFGLAYIPHADRYL